MSEFLLAYSDYFSKNIDIGTRLSDNDELEFIEAQRLVVSTLCRTDLEELERKYNIIVPDDVAELWLSQGTRIPLEAPLMELVPTGAARARDRLVALLDIVGTPHLLPVGIEFEDWGLGYYCVRTGEGSKNPVVYFPHPTLERGTVSAPLFASFSGMLEVMTFLFRRAADPLRVTPISPEEIDKLRRLDSVFGGDAWQWWWEPRFSMNVPQCGRH